jgi:saccharopine dehydrogenase-like NADP-dependent oxidoreductase
VKAILVGLGAVGARTARQLLSSRAVNELVVFSRNPARAGTRLAALGGGGALSLEPRSAPAFSTALTGTAVTILTAPGPCLSEAEASLRAGVPVVSTSDEPQEARSLLTLDDEARRVGIPVVVGAGMVPGLSCLLAAWVAKLMDEVSEIHVASLGTGGPACARRHHAALREGVEEWRDGVTVRRVGGSGRELVWFPDHAGADCYRLNRPDPMLLTRAFPGLRSVTTRAAASRRDRFTSRLPMLRQPHPEGTVGALRVEVRGRRAGAAETIVVGSSGRAALVAGAVAAAAAARAVSGQLRTGAGGLASLANAPGEFLRELSDRGVPLMAFGAIGSTCPSRQPDETR